MDTLHTDVAVIGAGTAGMAAFRAALEHTPRALLIEGGPYGTTCARVGCMPSKLLIAAAEAAHAIRAAPGFGVHAGPLRVDGRAVMDRVRRERDRFVGFVVESVQRWPAAQRLRGQARFVADGVLQVDEHTRVHADRIVVATGSSPALPAAWRQTLGRRLVVNDDVFDWQDLPDSVAVMGAGVIGLELAQALHRLGVRVRLFARSNRVGPLTDPLLQDVARQVMADELPLQLQVQHFEPTLDGGQVRIRGRDATGQGFDDHFSLLLAATGRRPNVDGLPAPQRRRPGPAAHHAAAGRRRAAALGPAYRSGG